MAPQRDIVILGAGHNGLVTAFYLAKAGLQAARSRAPRRCRRSGHHRRISSRLQSFHARACRRPASAGNRARHATRAPRPRDDRSARSPLRAFSRRPRPAAAFERRRFRAQISQLLSKRRGKYTANFTHALGTYGALLRQLLPCSLRPTSTSSAADEIWKFLKLGRNLRGLGKKDMMRLMRWGPMAVADLASEFFETELLRAAIAARGIFGAALGPWSAGSTALIASARRGRSASGGLGFVPARRNGRAHASAWPRPRQEAGAEIRTGADVEQILVKDGAATGVVLAGGEEISAKTIISNADPRRTFLKLIDPCISRPASSSKCRISARTARWRKSISRSTACPNFTALQRFFHRRRRFR